MAITKDGRILVVDRDNESVKVFSRSMKLQSSLRLLDGIWDIAILSDTEAIVGTASNRYIVIDISADCLQVIRTHPVPFNICGICKFNDKLIAVSRDSPVAVKMFDMSGKVYWSVSKNLERQRLYSLYVLTQGDTRVPSVIVTDVDMHALFCISGDDGKITRKFQLKGKMPRGITSDSDGNIYVCLFGTDEIVVLNKDMSEEKVLLSKRDKLRENPEAIVFDNNSRCLIVSYMYGDFLDIFKVF